ncbi:hypothetical protein [Halochromatium salexigens]|uniref:Uncharacterized protein n=1 Tax=Halochromatium salexigens TaxID=49447 RepID=A0AAJ0UCK7_HALSE|nr:hypothetical protein [Halochromatium salexigens]MBK5929074.1 hypothetical protein [Halochromatium salexigens]
MKTLFSTINLFGGFLAGLLGGLFQSNNALLNPQNGSDVIAVANTYIVFTTFIFVLMTIIVTGAGIYFSKWFGISKEKEIRENMQDLFESLNRDPVLSDRFVKELFEHKSVSDTLHKLVQARVEDEINLRTSEKEDAIDFSSQLSDDEEAPK